METLFTDVALSLKPQGSGARNRRPWQKTKILIQYADITLTPLIRPRGCLCRKNRPTCSLLTTSRKSSSRWIPTSRFWRPQPKARVAPRASPAQPVERDAPKVGRNDPCPCGSGKKYKKCCGAES